MGNTAPKSIWLALSVIIALATGLALLAGMSTKTEAQLPVLGEIPQSVEARCFDSRVLACAGPPPHVGGSNE